MSTLSNVTTWTPLAMTAAHPQVAMAGAGRVRVAVKSVDFAALASRGSPPGKSAD